MPKFGIGDKLWFLDEHPVVVRDVQHGVDESGPWAEYSLDSVARNEGWDDVSEDALEPRVELMPGER